MAAGLIGFTAGHRDRRGDGQRLLLRAVRLARRPLHVQRRVGRLLRRPRGRARGLVRPPRGRRARTRGTTARTRARSERDRAASSTQQQRTDRTADAPADPADDADARAARRTDAPRRTQTANQHGSASSYEARGQNRDRSSTASRTQRHQVGRVLRLLERQVGARRPARADKAAARAVGGGGGGGARGDDGDAMTSAARIVLQLLAATLAVVSCAPLRPQRATRIFAHAGRGGARR